MNRRTCRILFFLVAILAGFLVGILIGWEVLPVQYTHTGPHSLRVDFKTDYVLMVAERFQAEGDLALAVAHLSYLDETPPLTLVNEAVAFAELNEYAEKDLVLMRDLASAIKTYFPVTQ